MAQIITLTYIGVTDVATFSNANVEENTVSCNTSVPIALVKVAAIGADTKMSVMQLTICAAYFQST